MKKLIISFSLIIIAASLFGIFLNQDLKKYIWELIPEKIQIIYKISFKDEEIYRNLKNDYNVRFLPQTQLIKVNFHTKNLSFLNKYKSYNTSKISPYEDLYKYYIEKFENKIILVNDLGIIFEIGNKDLLDISSNSLNPKKIGSNLSKVLVLDTYIHEDTLFISAVVKNAKCGNNKLSGEAFGNGSGNFIILQAKINSHFYDFKKFYESSECGKNLQAGRMKYLNFNEMEGLLITTGDNIKNLPNDKGQNLKSIYGKTIFIDFKDKNLIIYSIGHRNAQGLFIDDDIILSTEHGPRGGDEINKIIFNKNYGWPYSSYGTVYPYNTLKNPKFFKNHNLNKHEEPIFSFVPSIAISEIIKIPNTFHQSFWKDNFLISSLGARSLFRIKFDDNYSKILFIEKIFVGQRIRDIIYLDKLNLILLSLENSKIGILKAQ